MHRHLLLASLLPLLSACSDAAPPSAASAPATPAAVAAPAAQGNVLRMRIDGHDWIADQGVFGTVQSAAGAHMVLISGSLGARDKDEQAFSLVLNGVPGPGSYTVASGNAQQSVAQMGNLSPERYLAGGLMLPYAMQVELVHVQAAPVAIEARFSGTLTANDGVVLAIEDGVFAYRE